MEFRLRNNKDSKHGSISTIKFPKLVDCTSIKSSGFQLSQKMRQLEVKLHNLAESQRIEVENNKLEQLKLERSILFIKDRMGSFEIDSRLVNKSETVKSDSQNLHFRSSISPQQSSLLRHSSLSNICSHGQEMKYQEVKYELIEKRQSKLEHDFKAFISSTAKQNPEKQLAYPRQFSLRTKQNTSSIQYDSLQQINDQSNSHLQDKINKKIESLKIQFQGKLRANNDRAVLDFKVQNKFQAKIKNQQQKLKLAQYQRKKAEDNSKMKKEIQNETSSRLAKFIDEESSKINKRTESIFINIKKAILAEIEKDRSLCFDEIGKLRTELEGRIKARDERGDHNAKREAEIRRRQDDARAKFEEVNRRMHELSSKLKADILADANRIKTSQNEALDKTKNIQAKLHQLELTEARRAQQQRAKAHQIQQQSRKIHEMESKLVKFHNESAIQFRQLQHQQKDIHERLENRIEEIGNKLEEKASQIHEQAHNKIIQAAKSLRQQQEDMQQHFDSQLSNLKLSLQSANQTFNHANSKKDETMQINSLQIKNLKQELTKQIENANHRLSKEVNHRIDEQISRSQSIKAQFLNQTTNVLEVVKKVEAHAFSERQKNASVYAKMSSDILNMSDHLTQLKNYLR